MKNQERKQSQDLTFENNNFGVENFTEIQEMVEAILTSLKTTKRKKEKGKESRSRRKWDKALKKKKSEDLKIRELPFTF